MKIMVIYVSEHEKAVDMMPNEFIQKIYTYITQILGLKAYDVMHDALFMDKNVSVEEAAKKLDESNVSEIIIIDNTKKIVGIVTDKDIVRRVVSKGLDPKNVKLEEIMTKNVIMVLGEADLGTVAQLMHKNNIRRVPVINRAGRLLGVVDSRDLAGALTAQRDMLKRIINGLEVQLSIIAKELEQLKKKEEEKAKKKESMMYG